MIVKTTYFDKKIQEAIIEKVGKPFSPLDIIKKGMIGSSRMIIKEYSKGFDSFINKNLDLTYASIGLRPKGIIVILSKSYYNLSWVISYHHLSIYKTDILSIHAEGEFLKLQIKKKQNKKLIEKLLLYKAKYMNSDV